jgi:hypothetical protein
MEDLSNNQADLPSGLIAQCSQPRLPLAASSAMLSRSNCLCCSDVLLRHVRSGQIYWRCGHCYQDMQFGKREWEEEPL